MFCCRGWFFCALPAHCPFDKINYHNRRHSSVVEQHFCKVKVEGPNPPVGSKDVFGISYKVSGIKVIILLILHTSYQILNTFLLGSHSGNCTSL